MTGIITFKDLDIWKLGIKLVKEIYTITNDFPSSEIYGLTNQMRRCAVSVPSNIAEGFRRKYSKEFSRFLNIALGSLAELETQLVIAKEIGFLKSDTDKDILEQIDHVSRMITNLLKKL